MLGAIMSHRLFLIVALSLFGTGTLVLPPVASAETPLTKATVQALRNQVQRIMKNRVTRAAQKADTMTPGDSLATARRSFAELRFNDNSLARIGERALFQFVPRTRNFYLGNGTALLLIPPGQGRTNVRTPNAAAGIRGSALFVRYNEDTNTTIVGALTNSRIEVTNDQNPQAQVLKAGQMAVIIQDQIVQVYNFDLNTFYQTSELVKDLDLPLRNATPSADPGIAAVQAETAQAVKEQAPLMGQVSENPAFVSLSPAPGFQTAVKPSPTNQITLTPSGFDLSTARQTLNANPAAQAFTAPREGVQSGVTTPSAQLSIPNAASTNGVVPPSVQPIIGIPSPDSSGIGGGTVSPGPITTPSVPQTLPTPPASAAPPKITPLEPVQPVPPVPTVGTQPPSPTPAPPVPARPEPAGSTVGTQPPSPAPAPQAPIQPKPAAPVVVTPPSNPTPAPQAPIQPAPAAPVVATPQPSPAPTPQAPVRPEPAVPVVVTPPSNPTPAPQAPVVTPGLRPDPVMPPAAVVLPTPTSVSPTVGTPATQTTIVTPPAVVTPTPTTLDAQTGATGTAVQVQPGIGGGAAAP